MLNVQYRVIAWTQCVLRCCYDGIIGGGHWLLCREITQLLKFIEGVIYFLFVGVPRCLLLHKTGMIASEMTHDSKHRVSEDILCGESAIATYVISPLCQI